jgi:hypothetical protein
VARNDPTDTGGLFIGRRPGTGPVRMRAGEVAIDPRRARFDRGLSWGLLAVEMVLCLSLFGPQPMGWMWVGSQVQYLTGFVTVGISTIMIGCLFSLMITMSLAKRVDHAWKLVRRAGGHTQERGALERIFGVSAIVSLVLFTFWFFIIEGPGSGLFPGQGA